MVNVTRYRDNCDTSCIIKSGEHSFIIHDSIINYGDARLSELSMIEKAVRNDMAILKEPVSAELLARIQNGARISHAFKSSFLDLL
ncbi:MAG: hypothetical protein HQL03_10175 [Nitrospirae bacterium]|nr:hypothetical protein [Nitrospirota bacterium]MBF0591619.1 hypothetical protein [Nitrospirota bacterium]